MDADRSIPPSTDADGAPMITREADAGTASGPVSVVADGATTVVQVRGDVDAVAAPGLRTVLLDAIDRGPEVLRIDMAEVEFLDSVGISVLVVAYNRAEEAGVAFELASVPSSSLRVLEITRLTEVFTIVG